MSEHVDDVETLAVGHGGPGPDGKAWQVVRMLPSRRVFRIDYRVTDGEADPQLTELPADWAPNDA